MIYNKANMSKGPANFERFLAYCPFCKVKLRPAHAEVLKEVADRQLIHVDCHHCQSGVLMVVAPVPHYPFYATLVTLTDLSKKDVKRAMRLQPLTADDVLKVHQYFKKSRS